MILRGPILFWISLATFYFDFQRNCDVFTLLRNRAVSTSMQSECFLLNTGYDWLLWIMSASGAVTLVIAIALVADAMSKR